MDPLSNKNKQSPPPSISSTVLGSLLEESSSFLSKVTAEMLPNRSTIKLIDTANNMVIDLNQTPTLIDDENDLYELEAVQDPYRSIIECLFILTSILALFFNISAIVLIFTQFNRHRRAKLSRIMLNNHKVSTAVNRNMYITTSHIKIRSGSSQLNIYLVNLFVNDILIAVFTTPFSYTDFMYGQWIYASFLCPVTNFISTCAVSVSIYTLIAIGLER